MRAYARQKQCKDSQKLNGYKKLPCILCENFIGEPGRYVWAYEKHIAKVRTFSTFARVSGYKVCICNTYYILCLCTTSFLKLEACC